MTFEELWKEVGERGFSDMVDDVTQLPRLKRYINEAYREIIDLAEWPFLEATKEGTAPLTISDLGHVLSAVNKTTEEVLRFLDRRMVVEGDPALDDTGSGGYWYREGETTLKVYPADSSSTLVVRYLKVPTNLSADSDVPVVPASYHHLIADGTQIRCLRARDNYEAAQFVRQEWKSGVKGMKHALLKPNYDRERTIVRTGLPEDYLW